MGLVGERLFLVSEGLSLPTTCLWVSGHRDHFSMRAWGVCFALCLILASRPLSGDRCHSCLSATSGMWGHLQLRASSWSNLSLKGRDHPMCFLLAAFCLFQLTSRLKALFPLDDGPIYPSILRSTCLRTLYSPLSVLRLFFPPPLLSTSPTWTDKISVKLVCWTRSQANHLFILNYLFFKYQPQYFHNGNMYFPPKKWHLTQQVLMEVTMNEGLGWKADLVAHVSEVLLIFTTFLNTLLYYIY